MAFALRTKSPCEVRVTNQRKDGSVFVNLITMHPVLDCATGCARLVIVTQREETKALLAGGQARDDAAAMGAAIPREMVFSEPALPRPCAAPTRALSGSAPSGFAPEERDTYWVGSPVRHHVNALRGLLVLRAGSTVAGGGSKFFLDFLHAHWQQLGRLESDGDTLLDTRLSLHSNSVMLDAMEQLEGMLGFCRDAEKLLGDMASAGDASSTPASSRAEATYSERIHALYDRAVKMEGGARGVGKGAKHRLRDAIASPLAQTGRRFSQDARTWASVASRASVKSAGQTDGSSEEDETATCAQSSVHDGGAADASESPPHKRSKRSDGKAPRESTLEKLSAHHRMLLYMLVFDVWRDLLVSSAGSELQASLAASAVEAEQELGRQLAYCITSLPSDTDQWIRLFISCVQDLDRIAVVVCDMSCCEAPILYANAGFTKMTKFALEEVVGRSCRFMQGPDSDPEAVEAIRDSIRSGTQAHVRLLNYRKGPEPTTRCPQLPVRSVRIAPLTSSCCAWRRQGRQQLRQHALVAARLRPRRPLCLHGLDQHRGRRVVRTDEAAALSGRSSQQAPPRAHRPARASQCARARLARPHGHDGREGRAARAPELHPQWTEHHPQQPAQRLQRRVRSKVVDGRKGLDGCAVGPQPPALEDIVRGAGRRRSRRRRRRPSGQRRRPGQRCAFDGRW